MSDIDLFARRGNGEAYQSIADRIDASGDCWLWTGYIDPKGYGRARLSGGGMDGVHRIVWESLVGPIPAGLQIDHLCRVRNCVNPDHMEPVTTQENTRRGGLVFSNKRRANA